MRKFPREEVNLIRAALEHYAEHQKAIIRCHYFDLDREEQSDKAQQVLVACEKSIVDFSINQDLYCFPESDNTYFQDSFKRAKVIYEDPELSYPEKMGALMGILDTLQIFHKVIS
jgi:hypothetical protein